MIPSDDHRDGPRDECGVFGIYAPVGREDVIDVARLTYFGLYALQHRGQESAGIATAPENGQILAIREQGLVSQVFKDEHVVRSLIGNLASATSATRRPGPRTGRTPSRLSVMTAALWRWLTTAT